MADAPDFKQYLRSLTQEKLDLFVSKFGGGTQTAEELISWAGNSQNETKMCDGIKRILGDEVLTVAQADARSAEAISRASLESAVETANYARAANQIAEAGNKLAKQANDKSEEANRIANRAMIAAWGACIAAIVAIGVSVVALMK